MMPQQVLEKFKFPRRQFDGPATPGHLSRYEVHRQVVHSQAQRLGSPATAQQRSNASQELGKSEWLDEIVICAAVQACDAILQGIAGRQQKYWSVNSMLADAGQDLKSIAAGKH